MKQGYILLKKRLPIRGLWIALLLYWTTALQPLYSQCTAPPCAPNNDDPSNFVGYHCGIVGVYGLYYSGAGEAIGGTPDGCMGALTVGMGGSYAINGSLEIQAGGSLTVESGGVAHIFGNMYNMGTIDVQAGGTLYFYGDQWINGPGAAVTGDGTIHFYNPRPAPDGMTTVGGFTRPVDSDNGFAAANSAQCFDAGDITMQPNFVFTNPNDINFTGLTYTFQWAVMPPNIGAGADNATFASEVEFGIDGTHLWLNNNNMTMTSSGTFDGCGANSYVVTNGTGSVIKQGLSTSQFLFPVGSCANEATQDYTPARITDGSSSGSDVYSVRVTRDAASVPDVTAPSEGPQRYWNITAGGSTDFTLALQHNDATDGTDYGPASDKYITRYTGSSAANTCGGGSSLVGWDRLGTPSGVGPAVADGALQCTGGDAASPSDALSRNFNTPLPGDNSCGTSYNGWYSKSYDHNTPLPIELLEFTATAVDNAKTLLKWSTATEKNNAYFSIQRSKDGITWQEIGQEKGAGNSLQTKHYTHWDKQPFIGVNYYRLEQFDTDGASSYSPIRAVAFDNKGALTVTAYPNPTQEWLNIRVDGGKADTYEMIVRNVLGQRIQTSTTTLRKGELHTLNTTSWTPGIYWLQIKTEQGDIAQTVSVAKAK